MPKKNTTPENRIEKDVTPYEDFLKYLTVSVEGMTDLICNKKNNSTFRALSNDDRKAQSLWEKQHDNRWEQIITSIHWRDGLTFNGEPVKFDQTNNVCCEEMLYELLENNAPCVTAFGLHKSWGQAVVRFGIDKYSTKFDAAVNVISPRNLVPIKFADWFLDTQLISPTGKGAPVTARLNHFTGWSAEIPLAIDDSVFSIKEVLTVIKKAGAGIGIGSGRSSGYGRYKVVGISSNNPAVLNALGV